MLTAVTTLWISGLSLVVGFSAGRFYAKLKHDSEVSWVASRYHLERCLEAELKEDRDFLDCD